MNDIKQLEERIAQLTELVKTGSETIKNMETALKAAEEERDRLVDQRREQEPKFERVESRNHYYCIDNRPIGMVVCSELEEHTNVDNGYYDHNNYFHTKERAKEVMDKINFLLNLERLHDTFCPDYKPNWNDNECKHFIYYNNCNKHYMTTTTVTVEYKTDVFFATREIAQKVCDILNKELREKREEL